MWLKRCTTLFASFLVFVLGGITRIVLAENAIFSPSKATGDATAVSQIPLDEVSRVFDEAILMTCC